jgi:stage II sporulation protein D
MSRILIIYFLLIICNHIPLSGQDNVRIRLFADSNPGNALFSVVEGIYELDNFNGDPVELKPGDIVFITVYHDRVVAKQRTNNAILCDSLNIKAKTGNDIFSLRADGIRRYYSGNLSCIGFTGKLLLINIVDTESYIAGVVQAEGGKGKHKEYYKTQAVIARTYLYKHYDKHLLDRYNLCDGIHCQSFKGMSDDTIIIQSAEETRGQVILDSDSILIIAAFHSNCGGETVPAEDAWLTSQPYLRKVTDPFCTTSRNAKWEKSIGLDEWLAYIREMGYNSDENNTSVLNFSQLTRMKDYRIDNFSLPLKQIRTDLDLRSTFFSLSVTGDSVLLKGKGYGHGVGLCQEGAMMMAQKGFDYRQIIDFYYSGVWITDIKNATPQSP